MGYVCITLVVCNTIGETFFGFWVTQTGNQNVFGELVYVEASSRQRRTFSNL